MFERVRDRVNRYFDNGDTRALLEPSAVDDAEAALDAAHGDPTVDYTVGMLYLLRHGARAVPHTTRDLRRAALLLLRFADQLPPRVAEQLRHTGTTADHWHEHGLDLFDAGYPDDAIEALEDAVSVSVPDSPEQLVYTRNLYMVMRAAERNLTELVRVGNRIVWLTSGRLDDYLPFAAVFGEDLRRCYGETGDLAILQQAVGTLRHAAELLPEDDENKVAATGGLCSALMDLFEATDDVGALEEAVTAGRRGVTTLSPEDRNYHSLLSATADSVQKLAGRTGDDSLKNEAVSLLWQSVRLTAQDDPLRSSLLTNLVAALLEGPDDGLQAALELSAEALRIPSTMEVHLAALTNRSEALRRSYESTGDAATLDLAIESAEQAYALGGGRVAFSLGLQRKYERTGDPEHLEQAIVLLREEVAATSQVTALHLLSSALLKRHAATGDTVALDEAAEASRRAVTLLPEGHPDRANHLNTLGSVLLSRYDRTGIRPVLGDAIDAFRAAIAATPETHPYRPGMLHNLGNALNRASESDEATALLREAAALAGTGSPEESSCWNDLGIQLRKRYDRTGDVTALDEAIDLLTRAADAAPDASAAKPRRLSNLGFAMMRRPGRETEAAAIFEQAALSPLAPTRERVEDARACGRTWADLGDWTRALAGFELAVELLPRIASHGVGRRDQEHGLGQFDGLAAEAAACALNAGDPLKAMRLLEQGRGILIAQQLDPGADLSALRSEHPELADAVARLRSDLQPVPVSSTGDWLASAGRQADRRHGLNREWDRLITHIRTLPGFGDFLDVPTVDALRDAAEAGPVVLVNVSRYRSDALVLTVDGIDVVALPEVTPDAVAQRAAEFHQALRVAQVPGPDERRAQDVIAEVLAWLWDALAAPVLAIVDARRVWWSPTGLLAFLPIHAAGQVMDRVISSYTPTIRALRHARSRIAEPTEGGLLAVAMPDTPGAASLPRSQREIDQLGAAVRLVGPTADEVRTEMTRHARVHFACHGISEPQEPSTSRLLLRDHASDPLTVQSIAHLDLRGARLAYLSACQTSQGAEHLSDEAVHITSGFLLAGYPEVIGTLWPVNDRVAARMAQYVYDGLPDGAAAALHAAVLRCRAEYPDTPSLWSAHIHTGA